MPAMPSRQPATSTKLEKVPNSEVSHCPGESLSSLSM